jgi:hypothetical protein
MEVSGSPYGEQILYSNFNQDQGLFAVGTTRGFRVFVTNPFVKSFFRGK